LIVLHEQAAFQRRRELVSAAGYGDLTALKGLLEGEGDKRRLLRGRDRVGRTPLTAAASANQVEAAKYLIQRGAEVTWCDGQRYTPLWRAYVDMHSPLRCAAQRGHVEMIHCLCAAGAGPWAVPSIKQGPEKCAVVEAVMNGHLEALAALLSYDTARPNCGRGMRVALDNVCHTWHVGIARKLQSHCKGSAGFNPMVIDRAVKEDQFDIMIELVLPQTEETRASIRRYLQDDESGPPSPEADLMIQVSHSVLGTLVQVSAPDDHSVSCIRAAGASGRSVPAAQGQDHL
jgi:ankyrin repeat protein